MTAALRAIPGGRMAAHDDAAERVLIGCCLLDADIAAELVHAVRAEDFFRDAHAILWEALCEVVASGAQPDIVTLRERLGAAGRLQRVGGDEFLLGFLEGTIPTLANAEAYARVVRDHASVRAVVAAAQEIQREGHEPIENTADYLTRSERSIAAAVDSRAGDAEPVPVGSAVDEVFEVIVRRAGGEGSPVSTGLADLDFALGGGLWPGEVTVLAGRPGTGKTALALQIARAVDTRRGPVLLHELEMPRRQLTARLLVQEARVDAGHMRTQRLTHEDMDKLQRAGEALSNSRIQIADESSVTIGDIARNARRQKRRGGLALVVIDYLQLLRPEQRDRSREREVGDISRAIKRLARALDVPLLVLASMNRDSESRGNKNAKPTIAQLRESGAIESDADNVALLYHDETKNKERPGTCDVILGKQRNGMTCDVELRWVKEQTRFTNLEQWRQQQ